MQRFYWVDEGILGGCSLPGGTEPRGKNVTSESCPSTICAAAESDLQWLEQQGVGGIISLTEEPLPEALVADAGLDSLHLPIPDLGAPLPEQFAAALTYIDRMRAKGKAVVVHCLMGQGRTGSILAAFLIRNGYGPTESIERLRTICPGALSSPEQERALHLFSERRDWVL